MDLKEKYKRVECLTKSKLLKPAGSGASSRVTISSRGRYRSWKENLPEVIGEIPPKSWFIRRGLQILYFYIYMEYQNRITRSFHRWKFYINKLAKFKRKFFDKWDVKVHRIKMNKLNAKRFIKLMGNLSLKCRESLLSAAFSNWRFYSEWRGQFLIIRLLFRCWKTVVFSLKQRKRKMLMRGLIALRLFHQRRKIYWDDLIRSVHLMKLKNSVQWGFRSWQIKLHNRYKMRKVLQLLSHMKRIRALFAAWQTWKYKIKDNLTPSSPPKSREPLVKGYHGKSISRKVSYQSSTGALVYRNVVAITKQHDSPRKENKKLLIVPKPTIKSVEGLSLKDKIKIRLENIKMLEEKYELETSIRLSKQK